MKQSSSSIDILDLSETLENLGAWLDQLVPYSFAFSDLTMATFSLGHHFDDDDVPPRLLLHALGLDRV